MSIVGSATESRLGPEGPILQGNVERPRKAIRGSIAIFFRLKPFIYPIAIILTAIALCSEGLMDENAFTPGGDSARHIMNGVFLYDFVRAFPVSHPVDYAIRYYATYPALSLGHHPILPALAQVPFFMVFGISLFSAKLTMLFFFILAGLALYGVVRDLYEEETALVSALLFMTAKSIVPLSRMVMSEIPAIALVLVSACLFTRYLKTDKPLFAYLFIVTMVCSFYAKQTTVVILPVFLFSLVWTKGLRIFVSKTFIHCFLLGTVLTLPLIPITLELSRYNVDWALQGTESARIFKIKRLYWLATYIWRDFPSFFLWCACLIAVIAGVVRKNLRSLIPFFCAMWFFIFFLVTRAPTTRHTVLIVPVLCVLGSLTFQVFKARLWRRSVFIGFILLFAFQLTGALSKDSPRAVGYQEAAAYVLDHWKGDSVLYCTKRDTGYFPFFVRKLNKGPDRVILLADKILATSKMFEIKDDRITDRGDIYKILDKFGVGHVVLEEFDYQLKPLAWLSEELKSDRFNPIKKIPIDSNRPDLQNINLMVYEYKGLMKSAPDAVLEIKIPLIKEVIRFPFKELLNRDIAGAHSLPITKGLSE